MDFAERKRKVEYLLRRKFPGSWAPPPLTPIHRFSSVDREVDSFNVEQHSKMMESIEAERRALSALPHDELDRLHGEAMKAKRGSEALRAQLEERGRFFNKRDADADFSYWSKVEYWTLDEALALLVGKSPDVVTWKALQPYVNISEFAKQYERLRNLALRAQAMNRGQAAVYPSAVLAWAAEMDIPVPQGLQAAIAERQAKKQATAATPPAPIASSSRPVDDVPTLTYIYRAPIPPDTASVPAEQALQLTARAVHPVVLGDDQAEFQASIRRTMTMKVHAAHLWDAIDQGRILPRSPLAGLVPEPPSSNYPDTVRSSWLLPLSELRKFCDLLLIDLVTATPMVDGADQWPSEMGGQRVWTVSSAFAELARQQAWQPSQGEELARQAVGPGSSLMVRDLQGLKRKPDRLSLMVDHLFTSDVNEWLEIRGARFILKDAAKEAEPPASAPAVVEKAEEREAREDRRLARLRELGGNMVRITGGWNVDKTKRRGALAALVREEEAAQRPRRDRKDVSDDLAAAAERERTGST